MAESPAPVTQAGEAETPAVAGSGPIIEKPSVPMPDEGPRLEGHAEGLEALAFQEGLSAYRREAWSQARTYFEKVTTLQPPSLLAPAALAFLAEARIRETGSNTNRLDGLNLYKTLLRDYPASANAHRAIWRIGDVYLEQAWYQEALSMYVHAVAAEGKTADGHRALLGVGYANLALGRWAEAVQAFQDLRKLTAQDAVQVSATVGLAHAVYRQHRKHDARALYHTAYRRWPHIVRQDAAALQRYAELELESHHTALGRELLLTFYNLSPQHPEAPAALLRVADSLQAENRWHSAELLYDLLATHHSSTATGMLAQMRLMVSVSERTWKAGDVLGAASPTEMIRYGRQSSVSNPEIETRLKGIAARHEQDVIGSEALFHLARHLERRQELVDALALYKDITARSENPVGDPWAAKAGGRLADILQPWIEAARLSHDDLTMVMLFQRHGQLGERMYLGSPLLLAVADAHRRLGFTQEAGRLYQVVVASSKHSPLTEEALVSLSDIYLGQDDVPAARRVLERARLQFPEGKFQREVIRRLMETMRRGQDWDGALHFCRQWLLRHPGHPERPFVYQHLASAFLHLNQPEAARIAHEEAFRAGAPKTVSALVAYADALSRSDQHALANEVYTTVLSVAESEDQRDWARLQLVRGWRALKQYDRAHVVLAELGQSEDELMARVAAHLDRAVEQLRHEPKGDRL